MARRLNPELYAFRWLADSLVERNISVSAAAEKIERTPSTIYNWLTGCYLKDAVIKPGQKDDVAELIACLLDCDVAEVRQQICSFLVARGQIESDAVVPNFRSEVAAFSAKIKKIHYYDCETALSTDKKELIYSVLSVLEKI